MRPDVLIAYQDGLHPNRAWPAGASHKHLAELARPADKPGAG
jgi:hypothetical protein